MRCKISGAYRPSSGISETEVLEPVSMHEFGLSWTKEF